MIRLTGRGSPAEDTKKVRPAMPVNGVCPPGLSQSKPLTPRAERRRFSAVRGDYNLMRILTSRMGPWAWLKARRSARPLAYRACPICQRKKGHGFWTTGAPAPAKEQGRRSFVSCRVLHTPSSPSPLLGGSRAKRAGWGPCCLRAMRKEPHPGRFHFAQAADPPTRGRVTTQLKGKIDPRATNIRKETHHP